MAARTGNDRPVRVIRFTVAPSARVAAPACCNADGGVGWDRIRNGVTGAVAEIFREFSASQPSRVAPFFFFFRQTVNIVFAHLDIENCVRVPSRFQIKVHVRNSETSGYVEGFYDFYWNCRQFKN